jgi:hypothetical protein
MLFSFPVRRFIQGSQKTETPPKRLGKLQWVLARPLYRFQTFDLAQVPAKNRSQALRLELAQWTPFANSSYYIGWHAAQALVWAWDADKVTHALLAQGLKPQQVLALPESVLQPPVNAGLSITQCAEGYELQHWRANHLTHTRWLAQPPTPEEWLMFQRDAGTPPDAQQSQAPAPRAPLLQDRPWVIESGASAAPAAQTERLIFALASLLLLVPTLWFGFSLLKLQQSTSQLHEEQAALLPQATPIIAARGQALDHLARLQTLMALDAYPSQLTLMAKVADILPQDKSYLKGWDFQHGQLKITLTSSADISTTSLIGALQKAGPFSDVKAVPGRDPKTVTFDMTVVAQ